MRHLTKMTIIITLGIMIFGGAGRSMAFRNEPDGYGGVAWGTPLNEFITSGTTHLKKKGTIYYGELMYGVEVDVGYEFHNDRLYGVVIDFPEKERKKIIKYFTKKYGEPTKKKRNRMTWLGAKTKIEVKRKDVEIVSIALENEYLKEKAKSKK